MKKNIIITADDFGKDIESNDAIIDAYKNGVLSSTCIMPNMSGFDDAVKKVKQYNENIDIGIHLNIIEGKSLIFNQKTLLTDENGNFNNSFIQILNKSYNKDFLNIVEKEFIAQIEKAINSGIKLTYMNSHVHTHSIPNLFKLCIKLCEKYNIKAIRTQNENFYFAPKLSRHFNINYFINIIKNVLLNYFTYLNKMYLKKYSTITTNENFLGVLYTANMDRNSILSGIKRIKNNGEVILHPTLDEKRKLNHLEYKAVRFKITKDELAKRNINLINWKDLI